MASMCIGESVFWSDQGQRKVIERERERDRQTDRQTEGNINSNNRKKETTARIKQHAAARTRADCNQQPQQTHTIKKIFFHAPDEF